MTPALPNLTLVTTIARTDGMNQDDIETVRKRLNKAYTARNGHRDNEHALAALNRIEARLHDAEEVVEAASNAPCIVPGLDGEDCGYCYVCTRLRIALTHYRETEKEGAQHVAS